MRPLEPLIRFGQSRGHSFALETQGSIAAPWFALLDWLILSPKPPSSGMDPNWEALAACISAAGPKPRIVLKIVVFDDGDYEYAKLASRHCRGLPIYLQVGNPAPLPDVGGEHSNHDALLARLRWLVGRAIEDHWFDATILPQLHVLAWGNKRGV